MLLHLNGFMTCYCKSTKKKKVQKVWSLKEAYNFLHKEVVKFYVADVFMHVHYRTSTILRFYQLASPMYNYLTVRLLHIVTMTTVWVRPLPLSTSAVISLPKSFVIALICILQLSVLAHSKTNQPLLSDVWIV